MERQPEGFTPPAQRLKINRYQDAADIDDNITGLRH
jgi:hypothetical protein